MLLELAQWLSKEYRVFSVFNYITLRAVLAMVSRAAVRASRLPWMSEMMA